jgi:hypothetical protein
MNVLHFSVVAGMLLSACGASTQSAQFVNAAPLPADRPVKYFSTKLPACDYEELGIVQSEPQTGFTKMQAVLDKMTSEARRMGGDAVINLRNASSVESDNGATVTVESTIALTGVVVRFKAADCTT